MWNRYPGLSVARGVLPSLVQAALLAAACCPLMAQNSDPAYGPLDRAYKALREKAYDAAIAGFQRAIEAAPGRVSIRKDLAYTYLKVGEPEAARDQFGEAMRMDPADFHVALEYAFLCFETREQAKARRIFDRIRQTGDEASRATAAQAFENVDRPLREGIARWKQAVELAPGNYSGHFELAQLGERRDELELAAEHYLKAWQILPGRKSGLLDLGRVWKALNRVDEAHAALLAASRGSEARAAETARGLLPERYPYVYEFRRALELDPKNADLRRELAYLLLRMGKQQEAEAEFQLVTELAPGDLLSAAQMGFFHLARKDVIKAMPLLERVLKSNDTDLAARVRSTLGMPPVTLARNEPAPKVSTEAKLLAERSFKAGYLKDAVSYLKLAHDADPVDFAVMLKMGWALNMLKRDQEALRWFNLARMSPDQGIADEATRAYNNLRPSLARFRTTVWTFPFYSSRWNDVFSYGQVKTDFRIPRLPVRPYLSARFVGDTRRTTGGALPQYLSESAFIFSAGLYTRYWHGLMAWGEAGTAVNYLGRRQGSGRMVPDYRGGVSYGKGFGHLLGSESPGFFYETNADGVFVSRFGDDFIFYSQNRFGYTPALLEWLGDLKLQLYLNANATVDANRQYWANFAEFGPGVRFRWTSLPPSLSFSVNLLRGVHTLNRGNPRRPNFFDVRAGFWYAFTH
jgi:tetratricopeptide (TPR) repeat protein